MSGRLVDAIAAAFEKHAPQQWGPGPLADFIEDYLAAHGLTVADVAPQPTLLPIGTWFRLEWESGKVGRWHRVNHHLYRWAACGCGTTANDHGAKHVVVGDRPDPEDCCRYLREREWAQR